MMPVLAHLLKHRIQFHFEEFVKRIPWQISSYFHLFLSLRTVGDFFLIRVLGDPDKS